MGKFNVLRDSLILHGNKISKKKKNSVTIVIFRRVPPSLLHTVYCDKDIRLLAQS